MIANSALMELCRLHRQDPSIRLKGAEGLTEAQTNKLEVLIARYSQAPNEINIGIVGEPNVLMTRWYNLWIGIETDGYAHS